MVLLVVIGNYAVGTIGNSSKVVLLVVIGSYAIGTIGNSSKVVLLVVMLLVPLVPLVIVVRWYYW